MKKLIVFFTLLCFTLVFTSCQKYNIIDNVQNSYNGVDEVDGVNEFKNALKENNIPFNTEEIEEESDFSVIPEKRTSFIIDGEIVIVYSFSSFKDAEGYKNNFDKGGCTIGNSKISWAGYPHFFQKWNLIVEYVGYSDDIVKNLENILGKEFSGYYAVGHQSHPKKN